MNAILLAQLPLVLGFMALLVIAARRSVHNPAITTAICSAALVGSVWLLQAVVPEGAVYFGGAYVITATGKWLASLCLGLVTAAILLTNGYLEKVRADHGDWKLVAMASALGMMSLALAGDLATMFISFELVSIPSYVLAGFSQRDPRSNEAGMKYLLLGALASALFLLGLSFLYGASGSLQLTTIATVLDSASREGGQVQLAQIALALLLAALFFKVAVAPFHLWIADIYQGSSFSALTIIGSPVKVAMFGFLFSLLKGPFASLDTVWEPALLACAGLSVVMGNLQAIAQTHLKRLFAYSGVANAGFVLLTIASRNDGAFLLYVTTYGIMTTGLWSALMASGTAQADADELSDLAGTGARHPAMAVAFTILLFGFAGVPPTAGFFAKFGAVAAVLRSSDGLPRWSLAILALVLVATLVAYSYYFNLLRQIWFSPAVPLAAARHRRWNQGLVFGLSALLTLTLGFLL